MANKLSFKNCVFNYNPEKLKIECKRNLVDIKLPLLGSLIQDLGVSKRIVKGSGKFIGDNCITQAESIESLMLENSSGALIIPGVEPMTAYLYSFTAELDDTPRSVSYTFEFWEDLQIDKGGSTESIKKYHTVVLGDSLWSIASFYGTTVSALLKLNPIIKRPDDLYIGQRVVIC